MVGHSTKSMIATTESQIKGKPLPDIVGDLEDTGERGQRVATINWDLEHLVYVGVLVHNLLRSFPGII